MTKTETLQAIFDLYETEHEHAPSRTRDAVDWAISQGLLATPPPIDPCEALANQMSKALAQELDTHKGHRYRVNHAVRSTKDGKPQSFWAIMGWVRLFFVDGPRGFCQRHGKSYLTRRRRGGVVAAT